MPLDLEKIEESPHLLDILVQIEDILDSLDIYVFANWFRGEIVEGPRVRRYWVDVTLSYARKHMPDPKGAARLLKHGLRVEYKKSGHALCEDEGAGSEHSLWLVNLSVPRRLISEMNAGELDFYDDEVEVDDVEDAQDDGVTDESAFIEPDASSPEGEGDPTADTAEVPAR